MVYVVFSMLVGGARGFGRVSASLRPKFALSAAISALLLIGSRAHFQFAEDTFKLKVCSLQTFETLIGLLLANSGNSKLRLKTYCILALNWSCQHCGKSVSMQ